MSVIKTYWAMSVEDSVPFKKVADAFHSGLLAAFTKLNEQIPCDSINRSTSGAVLLSFKEPQKLPWLCKKPSFVTEGYYHYTPKAKTIQAEYVHECRKAVNALPNFEVHCRKEFPNSFVSILGEGSHSNSISIHETRFGMLKGRVIMLLPVESEKPDYSFVPEGFVELSNSEYVELNKKVNEDDSTE